MTTYPNRTICASEFVGTMILVLAGAGSVAATSLSQVKNSPILIASVFGLTVAFLGICLGNVSGAHVNPAISLAHLLTGRLRPSLLILQILVQILGAICGGFTLSFFFPSSLESMYLGSTLLAPAIPLWTGTILEAAGTFALAIVTLTPVPRLGPRANSAAVGFTLFILIMILGPLTSASLNPARSLGPALVSGHLEGLEVYIIGPLTGGLIAGIIARIRQ